MLTEVAAPIFKLNENMLPPLFSRIHTALPLAIRIVGTDGLNEEIKLTANHSKDIDNTLLIDGGKTQSAEVNRLPKLDFLAAS